MGILDEQPQVLPGRRTRSDGERSRAAILDAATKLATIEGLEGLSIGRLADYLGVSKSGVFSHFSSKEELQLQTVVTAGQIFVREVVTPTKDAPSPAARLEALCLSFLSYLERGVFPGGCFFSTAVGDLHVQPEPVRDLVTEYHRGWVGKLAGLAREAQAAGELSRDEDPSQLVYELHALMEFANQGLRYGERDAIDRSRKAVLRRLAAARA